MKHNHNHSPLKHMLHMVLCCGLPIIIIGLLPIISRISPSASLVISKIVPFICPIMMISMMFMMMGGNKKKDCCSSKDNGNNNEIVELKEKIEIE
ncbi:hypothetical protein [Clostridium sp. 'White wine YQ']|uniref:hypothetical protein n=1 Tax=Clostridium sp. 'White wine YQ' TaxID=3027474 RepID=UPI002366EAD6|nr:hypothetical protein [Clostridium sp. 'White wine YQ']MDD7793312.1 hypothetical protein [Clostridium sp. 'White wine YQ']